jgi:uncharacterized protein YecE (DUF72 family)
MVRIRIGTAGWSVPQTQAHLCGEGESHLERYATVMNCAEVNTSFYRPHRQKTWQRWAATVPPEFKFAVKAPKAVTHVSKLEGCGEALAGFFGEVAALGNKLGPVLFQLPPSLVFDEGVAREFLVALRESHPGLVALEPRHASWFAPEVSRLLCDFEIARVAADPTQGSLLAAEPGGYMGFRYYRWHGSPRIYWSPYDDSRIESLASELNDQLVESWVIFDNTAADAALGDAVKLMGLLEAR